MGGVRGGCLTRRIAIDAIHLSRRGKGISRLQHGILRGLATLDRAVEYVVFVHERAELPDLPRSRRFTYVRVSPSNLVVWELLLLPLLARHHRVDLVLTMSDRLPLGGATPFVMFLSEVPDYRFELASKQGGAYHRLSNQITRRVFPRSLSRAALVVTPSTFTRDDLLSRYPVDPGKVKVLREAADDRFVPSADAAARDAVRARHGAPHGYVLHFSSNNDPRDNTPTAVRAFSAARPRLGDVKLMIAGDVSRARGTIESLARHVGIADALVFAGYVPDEDLPALYRSATVYFDPSLYEGFGLQVLEAMACGSPVVCSNTTSLPELVGDAAISCAPMDVDGFAAALARVVQDGATASTMRERGLARAQAHSWTETARQLSVLFDEVVMSREL